MTSSTITLVKMAISDLQLQAFRNDRLGHRALRNNWDIVLDDLVDEGDDDALRHAAVLLAKASTEHSGRLKDSLQEWSLRFAWEGSLGFDKTVDSIRFALKLMRFGLSISAVVKKLDLREERRLQQLLAASRKPFFRKLFGSKSAAEKLRRHIQYYVGRSVGDVALMIEGTCRLKVNRHAITIASYMYYDLLDPEMVIAWLPDVRVPPEDDLTRLRLLANAHYSLGDFKEARRGWLRAYRHSRSVHDFSKALEFSSKSQRSSMRVRAMRWALENRSPESVGLLVYLGHEGMADMVHHQL